MYNRMRRVYDNLWTIQTRMKLRTLMGQLRDELVKLAMHPNRLLERNGVFALRVTSQREIHKFLGVVQPKYKYQPRSVTL